MSDYTSAKDIASDNLVYIDGLASARDAVNLMKKFNVEALIIEKRNEKDANGILVLSDIVRGVIVPDKKLEDVSVYEIMVKPVISIPASLNIRYVPRFLKVANVNAAPVEENGKYIGLISLKDIVFNL
jgi:signal-transduction protein with cAMP-binding, CBS, and nucleotidyltransferase domain